jgi:alpha-L-fucosidase
VGSRLLGHGKADVAQTADAVTIGVPARAHDAADTVIALTLDGSAMDLAPIDPARKTPLASLSASNVYQGDAHYAAEMAYDNDEDSRWATDSGTKQAWLRADFDKPTSLDGVTIHEAIDRRVRKFEIQYQPLGGSDWITLVSGTEIGPDYTTNFEPVTAKSFRLNVLDATDGPTISEISFHTAAQ